MIRQKHLLAAITIAIGALITGMYTVPGVRTCGLLAQEKAPAQVEQKKQTPGAPKKDTLTPAKQTIVGDKSALTSSKQPVAGKKTALTPKKQPKAAKKVAPATQKQPKKNALTPQKNDKAAKDAAVPKDQWREKDRIAPPSGGTPGRGDAKKQDIRDMGREKAAPGGAAGGKTVPGSAEPKGEAKDERITIPGRGGVIDEKKVVPKKEATIAPGKEGDRGPAIPGDKKTDIRDGKAPEKKSGVADKKIIPSGQDAKPGDKKEKKGGEADKPAPAEDPLPARPEPVYIAVIPAEPGEGKLMEGWRESFTLREITRWARPYGLKPDKNAGPLAEGAARFVSRFGSSVRIEGLDRNRRYGLWIDFVTYERLEENSINARLEVFADREKIGDFNFGTVTRRGNPVRLDLPYHRTMDGKVEILFREYSSEGGFWGVWDLIVTDALALPDRFAGKKAAPAGMIDRGSIIGPRPIDGKGKRKGADIIGRKKPLPAAGPKKADAPGPGRPAAKDRAIAPIPGDAVEKKSPAKKGAAERKKQGVIAPRPDRKGAEKQPQKTDARAGDREKKAREMLKEDRKKDVPPIPASK